MIVTFDGLAAEAVAGLRNPTGLPDGCAFEVIEMQAGIDAADAFRVTVGVVLFDGMRSEEIAHWIWERIDPDGPLVATAGGQKARMGEPAALAWLIDQAHGAD